MIHNPFKEQISIEKVEAMLDAGVDPNIKNKKGKTAFYNYLENHIDYFPNMVGLGNYPDKPKEEHSKKFKWNFKVSEKILNEMIALFIKHKAIPMNRRKVALPEHLSEASRKCLEEYLAKPRIQREIEKIQSKNPSFKQKLKAKFFSNDNDNVEDESSEEMSEELEEKPNIHENLKKKNR